jgi:hypothetical protein
MSFKVPAVMQNENYKEYRKCEEGDYVKSKDDCDWCVHNFNSSIKYFEAKKYLSILMEVQFTAGGNWGNRGFNSLILRNNSVITIPSNQNVKNQLISEIKNHLVKNPLLITDPMSNQKTEYPILKEIEQWNVDDLTFYFKNDELRLIFNSGEHGNGNMNFDIALPQLQKFLNL